MSSAKSSSLSRNRERTSSEAPDDEEQEREEDNGHGGVPGDGICPSALQFDQVYYTAYAAWACPSMPSIEPCDIFQIDAFLDLIEPIPPFSGRKLDGLQFVAFDDLQLECALELETAAHAECDQSMKVLKSFQSLGYQTPRTCKPPEASSSHKAYPGLTDSTVKYLSSLVLAWSYILSCRWVEALQRAGLDASFQLLQSEDPDGGFWSVVVGSRWRAIVVQNSNTYNAPWTLRFMEDQEPMECEYYKDVPDSSAAFEILANFCSSHNMVEACTVALAIVMMLTSQEGIPLWLEVPEKSFEPGPSTQARDKRYGRLLGSIDKCMSLSCSLQGIESLLGSTFFDPRIPCTLMGAQRIAINNAVGMAEGNFTKFSKCIARRNPEMAILWLAAVWGGRGRAVFDLVNSGLPPINFLVAAWTGGIQSFLQAKYFPVSERPDFISRALEFSTSFFARPELNNPRVSPPPFGLSMVSYTGLEVRKHLQHDHCPRRARLRLISDLGEMLPTSEPWISVPCVETTLQQLLDDKDITPEEVRALESQKWRFTHQYSASDRLDADHMSCYATEYLFGWHAQWDEGLWLAGHPEDPVEAIRAFQSHPWLKPWWFDEESDDEDEGEDKDSAIKRAANDSEIMKWCEDVSRSDGSRKRTRAHESL